MNICTNLGQANKTMKRTVDNLAPNIDSYELKDKGVYITNERKASAFTELSSGGDKRLLKVYNLSFRYSGGKLYFDNIKKYDTKIWIRTDLDRHSDLHWDKPDSDYIKKYYRRPDMQEHGKWVLDRLKGLVELPIEG